MMEPSGEFIDIVFEERTPGEPPTLVFVEVEDSNRVSMQVGDWLKRDDGYWVLRLPTLFQVQG